MPYKVSKQLVKKMPAEEQAEPEAIGKFLFEKQAGRCWLCDGKMHIASEDLEADHDHPEGEGGPTNLDNLHLAHLECNRSKKNLSTKQIQPYLRLRRYMRENGGRLRYDGVTLHFGITPGPTQVTVDTGSKSAHFSFSDGTETSATIFEESVAGDLLRYTFVQVPRVAIFNDEHVQPRNIRYDHAFSIYGDLLANPLYEPPGCRLDEPNAEGLSRLLMFDGQHKTVATWMLGREAIVVKLYFNLTVARANYLVNSIQSKIKKLPLSAFELASKMSDEWRNKVDQYETEMSKLGAIASESGFLKWVPAGQERRRARSSFQSALMQRVLDHSNFRAVQFINPDDGGAGLTEGMIKSKILDKMLYTSALDDPFYEATNRREEEVENIVWMWNLVLDELAAPKPDVSVDIQHEARRRLFKQESLEHISSLLAQLYAHVMLKGDEKMLDGAPNSTQREQIEAAIKRICDHPVWTAPLDRDEKMLSVQSALSKNQGGKAAFEAVALKLSYALLGNSDVEYTKYWKS